MVLGGWHATTRTMVNDDGSTWTASTYYLDPAVVRIRCSPLFSAIYCDPDVEDYAARQWGSGSRACAWSTWRTELLVLARAGGPVARPFGWAFVGVASDLANVLTVAAALWLVGLLASQMRDDGRQGVHDRLARSLVVRRRRGMQSAWTRHRPAMRTESAGTRGAPAAPSDVAGDGLGRRLSTRPACGGLGTERTASRRDTLTA